MEIGKPLKRWHVVPLTEPVRPTPDPQPSRTPEREPEHAPEREKEPA